jgi:septal ring factor EnvC (AmiA/AmiB activator)
MGELIGVLKELSPIVTILGFGVTIFLLGWRIPSRAEMNRMADNLQKQIEKETSSRSNLQTQIEKETSNLQTQIDKVFATTLTITNEIREDMRVMQSQIVRLGEKIDANSHAIHADISKLTAKIEVVFHALRAEVGNRNEHEPPSQS